MKKIKFTRLFIVLLFLVINTYIYSEENFNNSDYDSLWQKELKNNITQHRNTIRWINIFNNLTYFIEQYPEKIIFKSSSDRKNYVEDTIYLFNDITLDNSTGFLSFIHEGIKYLYIPDETHPVVFPAGYQTLVPYSQTELKALQGKYWTFCFEKIEASSFLTENTKNGLWKYDGQDVERYPLAKTEDLEYSFISMPWVEGVEGAGIGEWIEVSSDKNGSAQSGVYTLEILNGYVDIRKPHLFKQNNRIKEATLICQSDDSYEEPDIIKIHFEDFVYVKKIVFNKGYDKIRLVIDSVHQGTKYDDTVVTSIHCPATVDAP